MKTGFIPCQNCGKLLPHKWTWYVCDNCSFRICSNCLSTHKNKGKYGSGTKCSQCPPGILKIKQEC